MHVHRVLLAAALALAAVFAGCGDDDGPQISKRELRTCLTDGGFVITQPPPGRAISTISPAFAARLEGSGTLVRAVLARDEQRSARVAADAAVSLRAIGAPDPGAQVLSGANLVLIFDEPPTEPEREAAERCTE